MNKKLKVFFICLLVLFSCGIVFADYYSKGRVDISVSYNASAVRITNTSGQDLHNVKLILNGKYQYNLGTFYKDDTETISYSRFSSAPSYMNFSSLSLFCAEGSYTVTN
ncbi:MAG: hypothetical protein IJP90_07935 [Treponema sp.]|nr:hypothetical protein [Treponema sp.]MBR0099633.1 hypothetical protein [Treponema sp.]